MTTNAIPTAMTSAQVAKPSRPPQTFRAIYLRVVAVLTVLFLALFTLPAWLLVGDLPTGFGVGAMAAFWGAPGFGVMIAGLVWQDPDEVHRPKPATEKRSP